VLYPYALVGFALSSWTPTGFPLDIVVEQIGSWFEPPSLWGIDGRLHGGSARRRFQLVLIKAAVISRAAKATPPTLS
jgi:hypothetical protein